MDVRRRGVISGLMACAASAARPARAELHTHPLTLRQLVDASDAIVEVVPKFSESIWVDVFGSRRIVTFWELESATPIVGHAAASHEVVTLGGTVGDVQQWVPHEAELRSGKSHLAFLRSGPLERFWVTGMLQGAFELQPRGPGVFVGISPAQRAFLGQRGAAVAQLDGAELGAARRAIRAEQDT